ncbi:MAG: carboxylesterase family protein [Propionibacteriaceae bacterium]|jgi:para-nitrobenzyl esterase|nr:carboxylesterase family protein [Propionibacteriaceae bacterium]
MDVESGRITAMTCEGVYRGIRSRGVDCYLGLRYGQIPGRFLPAVAPHPHDGVQDAIAFGPHAPQTEGKVNATGEWADTLEYMYPRTGSCLEGGPMDEDCLYLNVWAPADPPEPVPVLVWLHGGGCMLGTGAEALFNGANLARTGRAAVVTLNHRLGLLGFLDLERELGGEYARSGSVGIYDIVQALRWVRDNIAAFGGDPGNVTVAGQSGGGTKVAALLGMPEAQGLFHKAVNQSSGYPASVPQAVAQDRAAAALSRWGISAEELLELDWTRVIELQESLPEAFDWFGPNCHPQFYPASAFEPGSRPLSKVPVLLGTTMHEMSLMLIQTPGYRQVADCDVPGWLERSGVSEPVSCFAAYRAQYPTEPAALLLARIETERSFGLSAALAADHLASLGHEVYKYYLAFPTDAMGGALGACHSLCLPLAFGNAAFSPFAGSNPAKVSVSKAMSTAWLDFVCEGVPRLPSGEAWPRYDATGSQARIDELWSVMPAPDPQAALPLAAGPMWANGYR